MNHTPGPWAIATKRNENDNTITIGIPYLSGGSLEHVSEVAYAAPQPHYKDNQEANARLIAAAPEMLELIKDALEQLKALDFTVSANWNGSIKTNVAILLNAAIKKAQGDL